MEKLDNIAKQLGITKPDKVTNKLGTWKKIIAEAIGIIVPDRSQGDNMCLELICEICEIPVHLLSSNPATPLVLKVTTYGEHLASMTSMTRPTHVCVMITTQLGGNAMYDALTFVESPPKIMSSLPDLEKSIAAIEQLLHDGIEITNDIVVRIFLDWVVGGSFRDYCNRLKITDERNIVGKKTTRLITIRNFYEKHNEIDPFKEMHTLIKDMPRLSRRENKIAIKNILQHVSTSYWNAERRMCV
jgi:hypothetical protein